MKFLISIIALAASASFTAPPTLSITSPIGYAYCSKESDAFRNAWSIDTPTITVEKNNENNKLELKLVARYYFFTCVKSNINNDYFFSETPWPYDSILMVSKFNEKKQMRLFAADLVNVHSNFELLKVPAAVATVDLEKVLSKEEIDAINNGTEVTKVLFVQMGSPIKRRPQDIIESMDIEKYLLSWGMTRLSVKFDSLQLNKALQTVIQTER